MIRITFAAFLASTVSAHAADLSGSYICTYTAISGIIYDKPTERWKSASSKAAFLPEVVRVKPFTSTEEGLYTVTLKKLGDDSPERDCRDNDTAEKAVNELNGNLVCYDGAENHFNFESLKFQTYVRGGYMNKPMDFENAYVAVGTCEKVS